MKVIEPMAADDEVFFTDDDLAAMLDGSAVEVGTSRPTASVDARSLARTLAAQYAEVVAHHASDMVLGRNLRLAPRLRSVLADSRRLAEEMEDTEMLVHYERLETILKDGQAPALTAAARQERAQELNDWVAAFADLVGGEVGSRLVRDVLLKKGGSPLISHLREVKGIGEKRLERLYAAGLLTTDALVDADPKELAGIVGLPLTVAELVVGAARGFAEEQRRSSVQSLRQAAFDVMRNLRDVHPSDPDFRKLLSTIRDTLVRLERTISQFEGEGA